VSPGAGPGSVGGGRGRSDPSRGAPRRPRASFAAAQRGAVDARGTRGDAARAEKMPVESRMATGRSRGSGAADTRRPRRTISGSARSMCREVPLWYPRARDGAAAVCSMARARLPSPASGRDVILGVTKTCYRGLPPKKNVRIGNEGLFRFRCSLSRENESSPERNDEKSSTRICRNFVCFSSPRIRPPFSRIHG
jgi:hypothetical protein